MELDPQVAGAVAASAQHDMGIDPRRLHAVDFFQLAAGQIPDVDVVIGNPPFVRYQRFAPAARRVALRRAAERGVILPELTSTWAPFIVYAAGFLRAGGRLAMVAPVELTYAAYARPEQADFVPDVTASLDQMLRDDNVEGAVDLGDRALLVERLRLSAAEVEEIRRALSYLRERRSNR